MCHFSWFQKLSPAHTHPLTTIRQFSKPYELLFSELVTHKMLNVNWEKIHSIFYLSLVMVSETFPCSYTFPQNLS